MAFEKPLDVCDINQRTRFSVKVGTARGHCVPHEMSEEWAGLFVDSIIDYHDLKPN